MLIVFDWDGTLSDSTGKIIRCVQRAAHDLNLPFLQDNQVREIIGLGLQEAVGRLYPDLAATGIQALAARYSHHYLQDDEVPGFYPGVAELLAELARANILTAVATGKSRRGLNRVLEHASLENYFATTRCADETASKPNPQMLIEILDELNYRPQDAVMVGDTEFDMAMARALDMPRIGVSYGAHAPERLELYEPQLVTNDLRALLRWLEL